MLPRFTQPTALRRSIILNKAPIGFHFPNGQLFGRICRNCSRVSTPLPVAERKHTDLMVKFKVGILHSLEWNDGNFLETPQGS